MSTQERNINYRLLWINQLISSVRQFVWSQIQTYCQCIAVGFFIQYHESNY